MNMWSRDWFNRKKENDYTYRYTDNKHFSWDKGRTSYSSFFMKDNNLQDASKIVKSMFKVIGVPKDVKYDATIHTKSSGEALSLPIPLKMLQDESGNYKSHADDPELLDAFYGACIQNASLATMQSKYEYVQTQNARSTVNGKKVSPVDLLFSILNTERIDKKVAERYPGYAKFIQKFKNYQFDKKYQPLETDNKGVKLMELISKLLRYPASVTEEELEEFKEPIQNIQHYFKKNGLPATFDDAKKQSQYVYNVIQKYIQDMPEEEKPKEEEMQEGATSLMQGMINAEEHGEDDGSQHMAALSDFGEEDESEKNFKYDLENDGESSDKRVNFIESDGNKGTYNSILNKIDMSKAQTLANLFMRKCKDYQFSMKSMRSGRLDVNKLAEAKQGVQTVYERFGQVKTNKLNVGVLVDESGSMGGENIEKARQAAIFLCEIFRKVPDVNLYMYGHTADRDRSGDTDIFVYYETGKNDNRYNLSSIRARSNNRDGDAILATALRIRKQNENPCILFVISDGAPSASGYGGKSGIEDTREKVTKAQNLGFQVIQIAIESHVPSEKMFDYYVKMTNIEQLPRDLADYVSKHVDKHIKEKITL